MGLRPRGGRHVDAPTEELLRHARAFEDAQLPFMIVGALAVAAHGAPRASNDLDFVVHLPTTEKERIATTLRAIGHAEIDERRDEFGFRLVVRAGRDLLVEVFMTPPLEPYAREFSRRAFIEFHGVLLPFISPEDLVLRKLVNTRIRRGMDYDDIVSVLAVQGDRFDHAYVRGRCAIYRVCDLFERAVKDAEAALSS